MIGNSSITNIIDFRGLCGSIRDNSQGDILPKSVLEGINSVSRPVIGEIAGPDSIAAIIKSTGDENFDGILPVIALTGTEYGRLDFVERNLGVLSNKINEINGGIVFEPLFLYDPEFWGVLNGRFIQTIIERYGFYSPCLGCHLYVHAMRIPVALALSIKHVITGERERHGGRVKINQLPVAIDSYKKLMSRWNIKLMLPLRHVDENDGIIQLTQGLCKKTDQFKCVFKGNYCGLNDDILVDSNIVADFYTKFGLPATIEIIEQLLKDPDTNLEGIIKNYLR